MADDGKGIVDELPGIYGDGNPSGVRFIDEAALAGFRHIYVIGDIHGQWERLRSLWQQIDYDPEQDMLAFLGDYIDRGEKPLECLEFARHLSEASPNVICMMGNHEAMLLDYFLRHEVYEKCAGGEDWIWNGGRTTFTELAELYARDRDGFWQDMSFIRRLYHLAVIGDNYLLTHAGFLTGIPYQEQYNEMLWYREVFYNNYNGLRTVLVGHTPVQCIAYDKTKPILLPNHILLCDTGSYLKGGHITCVDVKSLKIWQSQPDDNGIG